MLRVVGIKENGDLIIEKTSSVGKTDEQIEGMEKIYEILKREQEEEEKQAQEEYRHMEGSQAEMILISAYGETVAKVITEIMEKLKQDFQPFIEVLKRIAALVAESTADTMKSLNEMLEAMREKSEENRIENERRCVNYKMACSRRKARICQQARKTLKYRPYELRIYKIL